MKIRDAIVALEGHYIVELDYSQLEVYCLAAITGDEALIDTLNEGDFHANNLKAWIAADNGNAEGKSRKMAKAISFQLQYGAQAKGMSDKLGIPKKECQSFIDGFYDTYDQVRAWHTGLVTAAENGGVQAKERVQGYPVKEYRFESGYGKGYLFRQLVRDSWNFGVRVYFKPTFLQNYPVQGLASDIIRFALAALWRSRMCAPYKVANTIHDSIKITCKKERLTESVAWVTKVMKETPILVLRELGFHWPEGLELKVDVEYGTRWSEMTVLEPPYLV